MRYTFYYIIKAFVFFRTESPGVKTSSILSLQIINSFPKSTDLEQYPIMMTFNVVWHHLHLFKHAWTVNWEIFLYENIHVLNIHVNKFSGVTYENILTRRFVKLKLLCMYCQLTDY